MYVLIENGVVVQKQPNEQEGFIKCDNSVSCGYLYSHETEEFSAPEVVVKTIEWPKIRKEREAKLTACDWTQLNDSPLSEADKEAYAVYRQELRDITDAYATPDAVVWPSEPNA